MRHRVQTKQLGRNTKQRQALLKSLVRELVVHGAITTTQAKAKAVRPIADKLIGRAKTDTVSNRRLLHEFFGKRDVVNSLFERVAPVFSKRTSGFTRIVNLGIRRGDNAQVVRLELVEKPEILHTLKNPTPKTKDAKAKVTKTSKTKAAETKKAEVKTAKATKVAKAEKATKASTPKKAAKSSKKESVKKS